MCMCGVWLPDSVCTPGASHCRSKAPADTRWRCRQGEQLSTAWAGSKGKLLSPDRDMAVLEHVWVWWLFQQTSWADAILYRAVRTWPCLPPLLPSPEAAPAPSPAQVTCSWARGNSQGYPSPWQSSRWSRGCRGVWQWVSWGWLHREMLRWNSRMLLRGTKSASAHVLQPTTSVWCPVPFHLPCLPLPQDQIALNTIKWFQKPVWFQSV